MQAAKVPPELTSEAMTVVGSKKGAIVSHEVALLQEG